MTHGTQKKESVSQNVKAIYLQPSVPRLNHTHTAWEKQSKFLPAKMQMQYNQP